MQHARKSVQAEMSLHKSVLEDYGISKEKQAEMELHRIRAAIDALMDIGRPADAMRAALHQRITALDRVEAAGDMSAELYLLKGEILNHLGRAEEAEAAFNKADEMMR